MRGRFRFWIAPSLCPCRELCDVMGGAEHCPFVGYLFDAAEEELAKAAGVLGGHEYGSDDMCAQPVATSAAALPDPGAHGLDQRPALGTAGWAAGAAGGDIAADGAVDEASQVGFRAEPGIGGHFVRRPVLAAVT